MGRRGAVAARRKEVAGCDLRILHGVGAGESSHVTSRGSHSDSVLLRGAFSVSRPRSHQANAWAPQPAQTKQNDTSADGQPVALNEFPAADAYFQTPPRGLANFVPAGARVLICQRARGHLPRALLVIFGLSALVRAPEMLLLRSRRRSCLIRYVPTTRFQISNEIYLYP